MIEIGEIEYGLSLRGKEGYPDKFDGDFPLLDLFQAEIMGFPLIPFLFVEIVQILLAGHPEYLRNAGDVLYLIETVAEELHHFAELFAAQGFNDHKIVGFYLFLFGFKMEYIAVPLHLNRYYPSHRSPLSE